MHAEVQAGEYIFFQFFVPESTDDQMRILSVKIYVTLLSGEVITMTSRKEPFPNIAVSEKNSFFGFIEYS